MDILNITNGQPPHRRRRYTAFSFLFDIIMITITGGFWIIWIFIREMRNANGG